MNLVNLRTSYLGMVMNWISHVRTILDQMDLTEKTPDGPVIRKQKFDEHSIPTFNYPYQAMEEAVVNSLYHRDYQDREPVEITVEPDKISIPRTKTPQSLTKGLRRFRYSVIPGGVWASTLSPLGRRRCAGGRRPWG